MLEKLFKLKENKTDVKTEVIAGLTTFMTMAYILAVNPSILSAAGMDSGAVLAATALASFFGCLCMALLANYPFALAPGMGLNAYFAFSVCIGMGVDWRIALAAVFVEGIIFIILSLTNVREAIFNAIPLTLKYAVSGGIGLFIAFIGCKGANLVVSDASTFVTYQHFTENVNSIGVGAVLALIGIILTAVFLVKKVKGAILFGILSTYVLGILCQLIGIYVPNPEVGMYSLYPAFDQWFVLGNLSQTAGQVFLADFSSIMPLDFIMVIFAFLFVDIFDTLGTLMGVASKANMLDEEGKLPRIRGALLADALATSVGAVLGTSTTTTFVESSAGVSEGGRTGLSSAVTGFLFFLSGIFLAPLFMAIPSFATAPALVVVGCMMMSNVLKINFNDFSEAIPAFLTIACMPFMYSISEGIAVGFISYVAINVCTGKAKEKKISPLMYVLAILFVCKYIFLK
ncbi:MAG: NCS2 family permease [Lachnospiraceae bacterium]|nr:NCS2 family permease [Lachnospiraceae bacterium]